MQKNISSRFLTGMIGFIMPVIGVIIFLVKINRNKEIAHHALFWAAAGSLFSAVLWWIVTAAGVL